jgi:hypothetical protein
MTAEDEQLSLLSRNLSICQLLRVWCKEAEHGQIPFLFDFVRTETLFHDGLSCPSGRSVISSNPTFNQAVSRLAHSTALFTNSSSPSPCVILFHLSFPPSASERRCKSYLLLCLRQISTKNIQRKTRKGLSKQGIVKNKTAASTLRVLKSSLCRRAAS